MAVSIICQAMGEYGIAHFYMANGYHVYGEDWIAVLGEELVSLIG